MDYKKFFTFKHNINGVFDIDVASTDAQKALASGAGAFGFTEDRGHSTQRPSSSAFQRQSSVSAGDLNNKTSSVVIKDNNRIVRPVYVMNPNQFSPNSFIQSY